MARIAAMVHSAVEMLCAPCALQMVTCGPASGGIHSVPAIIERMSFTPRRLRPRAHGPGGIGVGNPDVDLDVVVELVGDGNQFDSVGEIAEELESK